VKDDGYHDPNIRVLVRPILNLFHGDRGGKKWKNAVDGVLKAGGLSSFTDLMDKTLGQIPDEILDAPPRTSQEAALILGNGVLHPCFDALPDVLAQPGDRARGENERRRGGSPNRKEKKREQQQHQADAVAAVAAEQQRRQQELLHGSGCGCGDGVAAEAVDRSDAAAAVGDEQAGSIGSSSEAQAAAEQQHAVVAAVGA
jgi:hypothetical protein